MYRYRFIVVILLLGCAAALLTDKNKLPLALRGVRKVLQKDQGAPAGREQKATVTPARRLLAFVLILIAFAIAVI